VASLFVHVVEVALPSCAHVCCTQHFRDSHDLSLASPSLSIRNRHLAPPALLPFQRDVSSCAPTTDVRSGDPLGTGIAVQYVHKRLLGSGQSGYPVIALYHQVLVRAVWSASMTKATSTHR